MRVGAEGREFSAERNHLGERGGAIRISVVAALGGLHHVAAAPQVVERVVHGDLGDAKLVGEFNGSIDGAVGHRLAELLVGIPAFRRGKARWQHLDLGSRDTATGSRSEQVVEVERLERMVGADAMACGLGGELGTFGGFLRGVPACLVGFGNECVVIVARDDEEVGHGGGQLSEMMLAKGRLSSGMRGD